MKIGPIFVKLFAPTKKNNKAKENNSINNSNYKDLSSYPVYMHPSFLGRKKRGIYAIGVEGKPTRFENVQAVATFFKTATSSIYYVLAGHDNQLKGFTFAYADELELKDEKGEVQIDDRGNPKLNQEKINKLRERFLTLDKLAPILAFDKNGKTKIYRDLIQLSEELGIDSSKIKKPTDSPKVIDSTAYMYLKDAVKYDENGKCIFSEGKDFSFDYLKLADMYQKIFPESILNPFSMYEKLIAQEKELEIKLAIDSKSQKVVKARKRKTQELQGGKGIYVLNYDGTYKKYSCISEAVNSLGGKVSYGAAYDSVQKSYFAPLGNYIFLNASKVEYEDKNGEWRVDKMQILQAINSFKDSSRPAVYLIDVNGKVKRYFSTSEMAQDGDLTKEEISMLRNSYRSQIRGMKVISAYELEKRDENGLLLLNKDGTPKVDKKLVKQILSEIILNLPTIVSIAKDGTISFHENGVHADKDLGLARGTVSRFLNGYFQKLDNCVCFNLFEAILKDENGDFVFDDDFKYVLDYEKIKKAHKERFEFGS